MISKDKWDELKSDWQRYGKEYLAVGVFCLFFLLGVWFLVFKPAMDDDHENDLLNLKTELLQKIKNNSVELSFLNETEAKKAKSNLEEISENDNIHFKNIKLYKKGKKFEIKIQFKSANWIALFFMLQFYLFYCHALRFVQDNQ